MSKREPLLSDKTARFILADHGMDWRFSHRQVVIYTRDHYEKLIDEGKLRVVEECEVVIVTDDLGPTMPVLGCNGRGPVGPDEKWCPFCGNKIKR